LPASIKRTDTFGSSERRDASTEPAVPCGRSHLLAVEGHGSGHGTHLHPRSHNRMISSDFCHLFLRPVWQTRWGWSRRSARNPWYSPRKQGSGYSNKGARLQGAHARPAGFRRTTVTGPARSHTPGHTAQPSSTTVLWCFYSRVKKKSGRITHGVYYQRRARQAVHAQ
jgi:hypothetical protein